jgi:hypothetical protein
MIAIYADNMRENHRDRIGLNVQTRVKPVRVL